VSVPVVRAGVRSDFGSVGYGVVSSVGSSVSSGFGPGDGSGFGSGVRSDGPVVLLAQVPISVIELVRVF
jgi:hypothetical protein